MRREDFNSLQTSLAGQSTGLLTWSPLNTCLKGGEGIIQDIDPISRRLREAKQKIRILYEIARIVSSLLDVQLVLDAIVNLLWKEFNLDACSIRLLDTDGKLRIRSQQGLSKAFIEEA